MLALPGVRVCLKGAAYGRQAIARACVPYGDAIGTPRLKDHRAVMLG